MAATGTPWFRVYAQLRGHPKVDDLARRLKISPAQAIGHLVMLWCWAVDYRPNGDLAGVTSRELEAASGWTGRLGAFTRAANAVRWIDGRSGSFRIHNWLRYAESYKRANYKRKPIAQSTDSPPTVHTQSTPSPPERRGEERIDERTGDHSESDGDSIGSTGNLEIWGYRKYGPLGGKAIAEASKRLPLYRHELEACANTKGKSWGYFWKVLDSYREAQSGTAPAGSPTKQNAKEAATDAALRAFMNKQPGD